MSPTDRKEQILEVAEELLLVRGFSAFSYQDLSDRLGITKASIHHHFPSKEELGLALCDRFEEEYARIGESAGDTPRDFLEAMLAFGAEMARMGDRCCPGGVLQAEYNALPPKFRDRVDVLFKRVHEHMTSTLEAGRAAGQLAFSGEPADHAWFVLSLMHGAALSARVHGAPVYEAVARQLRATLYV